MKTRNRVRNLVTVSVLVPLLGRAGMQGVCGAEEGLVRVETAEDLVVRGPDALSCSISLKKSQYQPDEPIPLRLSVMNTTREDLWVFEFLRSGIGYELFVRGENGIVQKRFHPKGATVVTSDDYALLHAGKKIVATVVVNDVYDYDEYYAPCRGLAPGHCPTGKVPAVKLEGGEYTMWMEAELPYYVVTEPVGRRTAIGKLKSNTVSFTCPVVPTMPARPR